MSTSDAALEIKDRAETVQGQIWEALVTALLLLPCNPSPKNKSWGPPSTLAIGLAQQPRRNIANLWLIPAHPSPLLAHRLPRNTRTLQILGL